MPSDLATFLAGGQNDAPAGAEAPETEPHAPEPAAFTPPASMKVALGDRFTVMADEPLPALSTTTAAAFAARDRAGMKAELFALVVQSPLPARIDIFNALRQIDQPSIMRLAHYGIAEWPEDGRSHPIVLFERPTGDRLVRSLKPKQKRAPMTEDQVTRMVILPMIAALREFKLRRLFHGTINPTNLYLPEGAGGTAQLGECATAPAGYLQPVLFETIERGMAMPTGRGNGAMADDLYALGATILYLLLDHCPLLDLEPRAMLAAKIEKGSFAAMTGDARLPLGVLEPLRGLLMDDPRQRWTVDDLDLWVSGRRLSPRQSQPPKRAPRPIAFNGNHWNTRTLATALTGAPPAADALIESGELNTWLRRSLEDDKLADLVAEGVRTATAGRGGPPEERRVARVAMALDSWAPIRYRGKAVMPEGIGTALADAVASGNGVQEIAEIISGQLPMFWVNVQQTTRAENLPIAQTFDALRGHLERTEPGYGVERCLYTLNPSMPCLSPAVDGRYVLEIDALLRALEDVAGMPGRPDEPIDRHIAAFIAARRNDLNEALWVALGAMSDRRRRILAMLDLFCDLQITAEVYPLPNLCAWMVDLLNVVVDGFYSRTVRERLREELASQAASGMLRNLVQLAHNTALATRDVNAFNVARIEFARTVHTIAEHERTLTSRERIGGPLGRQIAAVASAVISAALLFGIIVIQTT